MRYLKWLAIIAVIVAVIAVIVHLRRDAIARDVANSMLEERGFTAADLKVDSLSPSRLVLALLVIESESGARYEVVGLSLPLSVSDEEPVVITAEHLDVSYDTDRDRQAMLSTTLDTIFALPGTQPKLEARVDSIALPGFPDVRDAALQMDYDGASLSAAINDIEIVAALTKGLEGRDRITLGAAAGGEFALGADVEFATEDGRYRASGNLAADFAELLPTLQALQLAPPGLERLELVVEGPIEVRFDDAAPGTAGARFDLDANAGAELRYRVDSGRTSAFVTTSTDPLAVDFAYPSNDWRLAIDSTAGTFVTDGLSETTVDIRELQCTNGINCSLEIAVDSQALTWNDYSVDAATIAAPLSVIVAEETRVSVAPESAAHILGLQSDGVVAAEISLTGFSGTDILVDESGWLCQIDTLQLAVTDFVATDTLLVSPLVELTDFEVRDSGETLGAAITISAPLSGKWKTEAVSLPGAAGSFAFANEDLQADVSIVDPNDAIAGNVAWRRNTLTDSGSLDVTDGWASFDRARLSDYLPTSKLPFDILQGNWDIDIDLEWQVEDGLPLYRGETAIKLDGVGGTWSDFVLLGLTTSLAAKLEPDSGLAIVPAPVGIRMLDVGVPVENISFDYDAVLSEKTVRVPNLTFDVFGGSVTADPFAYTVGAASNEVSLRAADIQLQLMVDTLEFEALELNGAVSGVIPVTMTDDTITVRAGQMANDAPGTIRYLPPNGALDAVAPAGGLGAVTQALTNFEFETLSSTIDYTEGGDMKLLMRIVGINPDLDPDQPYAFNLNLENNIPQMLRSLRAVRSIEDILKQQTAN